MVTWVVFLSVGLVVGLIAGVLFGQLDIFKKKQREELKTKLEAAEKELATYKMEVTEHFLVTASLVNSMTESYQAVHEHLAKGANRLCDSTVNVNRLSVAGNRQLDDKPLEKTLDTENLVQADVPTQVRTQAPTQAPTQASGQPKEAFSNENANEESTASSQQRIEKAAVEGQANNKGENKASGTNTSDASQDPLVAKEATDEHGLRQDTEPKHITTEDDNLALNQEPSIGEEESESKETLASVPETPKDYAERPADSASETNDSDELESVPTAQVKGPETKGKPKPSEQKPGAADIVEPPSTPESLSFEDDELPGSGRTVH